MVTGAGDGAAIENITPVRSMRVDGPGRLAHLEVLDEQRRHDLHRSVRVAAGAPPDAPEPGPSVDAGPEGASRTRRRPRGSGGATSAASLEADLGQAERPEARGSPTSPGRSRTSGATSRADVGAAWWLLCSPSPAVMNASHCRLPAPLSYGRRPKWWPMAFTARVRRRGSRLMWTNAASRPATGPSTHDEHRRCRRPGRRSAWSNTSAVPPVVGDVLGVAGDASRGCAPRCGTARRCDLHVDPAEQLRRVRIALDVGEGVVLAVHRHPLAGPDAGGDPDQKRNTHGRPAAQRQGPVRQGAVQVDRGADVGQQRDGERRPPRRQEGVQDGSPAPSHRAYLPVGRAGQPRSGPRRRGRCGASTLSTLSTREAILAEALHCFAEHGYDGTSLNDIAAGVGIRRPSLLHHFPSKEALYGEVFERPAQRLVRARSSGVAGAERGGWAKVELVLDAGFDFFAEQPRLRAPGAPGGASTAAPTSASTSPPCCADVRPRASPTSRREMAAGTFRHHDPTQLLLTGYGALLSYFSDAPFLDGPARRRPARPTTLDQRLDHLRSFFPPRAARRRLTVHARRSGANAAGGAYGRPPWRPSVVDGSRGGLRPRWLRRSALLVHGTTSTARAGTCSVPRSRRRRTVTCPRVPGLRRDVAHRGPARGGGARRPGGRGDGRRSGTSGTTSPAGRSGP